MFFQNKAVLQKIVTCLWVIGILAWVSWVPAVSADKDAIAAQLEIDPENNMPIELNSVVMEVNSAKSYVIVGEKQFELGDFMLGKEKSKSSVVDAQGNPIQLKALKKETRVIVTGFALSDGRLIAQKIQITKSQK